MLRPGKFILFVSLLFIAFSAKAQLQITPAPNGQALAQRLVGEGVTISNVVLTADPISVGFFKNLGGTAIGIDSGIVLTTGRAATAGSNWGVNGNGTTLAQNALADFVVNTPGDQDLAASLGIPADRTGDAAILEFDFTPLGDSIQFRYVFSSEEYIPEYVCDFNDAFAFFISGPGFTGMKNIALVPGTNIPVSILNVNDVPGGACPNNMSFYIDNLTNKQFTHDGHTKVFIAAVRVQPCQTYHLKLVIADMGDQLIDSGVFLEAKSLSSNATHLINLTQTDPVTGISYLVEGCATGSLNIKRRTPGPFPLTVNLAYGGTVANGVDIQPLPASIVIPANQDSVLLDILPVMDLIPEGIETLKIYTLAACPTSPPTDSTIIQLRDYDILGINPDTAYICRNSSVQLHATNGYTTYTWDANPALSSTIVPDPTVMLSNGSGMFVCTATVGTCMAKDSAFVKVKDLELLGKTDVQCRNGTTGQVRVGAGFEWTHPLEFSIDGGISYQTDSTFSNLPAGNYTIRVRDASGCIDSISTAVIQAFPDLVQTNTFTQASCTGNPDGTITITASGGNPAYQYAINNGPFVTGNTFNVLQGTYNVKVKDANGCTVTTGDIIITLNNTLAVEAGNDETICEGSSVQLNATTNQVATYSWTPSVGINNASIPNPAVSPVTQTKYIVTATAGICSRKDSVIVFVDLAPIPNAGKDITICFGANAVLQGTGAAEYLWTPSTYLSSTTAAQPTSQRPLSSITYYLTVKDAKGCSSLLKDTVNVIVTPAVKLFAGNDSLTVAINQPVQLNVVQVGDQTVTQYTWSPSYGLSSTIVPNPVTTLDRDYTYYVTGRTLANCEGTDTIHIKVYKGPEIYVPTAFTPNSDGRNDVLKAIAIGMKEYRYFRIFNRYGQLVFETKGNFNRGWDGRIKGVLQHTGAFVWMAETVDYKGNVIQRKGTTMIIQ